MIARATIASVTIVPVTIASAISVRVTTVPVMIAPVKIARARNVRVRMNATWVTHRPNLSHPRRALLLPHVRQRVLRPVRQRVPCVRWKLMKRPLGSTWRHCPRRLTMRWNRPVARMRLHRVVAVVRVGLSAKWAGTSDRRLTPMQMA